MFNDYLDPNERILWSGRPPTGFLLRPQDAFLIPFSMAWGGMAIPFGLAFIAGFFSPQEDGAGFQFSLASLIGLPFMLIPLLFLFVGLYITVGRFYVDAIARTFTRYAVTNRRVLILGGWFRPSLKALPLTPWVEVRVSGRRRGSIAFGPATGLFDMSSRRSVWSGPGHGFVFERIDDPHGVYRLIRSVQTPER